MPKLWNETIEAHRKDVREAIIDTTAALVSDRGLVAVTMSKIAENAGIGRATLYKYYPDIESILSAWHQRQISGHLQRLEAARHEAKSPVDAVEAVLAAYAWLMFESRGHHDSEIASLLHRDGRVAKAESDLHEIFREVLIAARPVIRRDIDPDELATYCVHALLGASQLRSEAEVGRLVSLALAGLYDR